MSVPSHTRRSCALREVLQTIVTALIVALCVRTYLFGVYRVAGPSMEGTLHTGEHVVVWTWRVPASRFPTVGDVVVFEYPRDRSRTFIKRVAAVGGDRVAIRRGRVFVNGSSLREAPSVRAGGVDQPETIVPPDTIWVLGDNRVASEDSRLFGEVPLENIKGVAVLRLRPPIRVCRFVPPSRVVSGKGGFLACP